MRSQRERFARMKSPKAAPVPEPPTTPASPDEASRKPMIVTAAPSPENEAKTPKASGKTPKNKKKQQQQQQQSPSSAVSSPREQQQQPPPPPKTPNGTRSRPNPPPNNKQSSAPPPPAGRPRPPPAAIISSDNKDEPASSYATQRAMYMKMRAMDDGDDSTMGVSFDNESNAFDGVSYSCSGEDNDDSLPVVSDDAVSDPPLQEEFTMSVSSSGSSESAESEDFMMSESAESEEFTHIGSMQDDESKDCEEDEKGVVVQPSPAQESEKAVLAAAEKGNQAASSDILANKESDKQIQFKDNFERYTDQEVKSVDPISTLQIVSSDESSEGPIERIDSKDDEVASESFQRYTDIDRAPLSDDQSSPATDPETVATATDDNAKPSKKEENIIKSPPKKRKSSGKFPSVGAFQDEWPEDNFSSASWSADWGNGSSAEDEQSSSGSNSSGKENKVQQRQQSQKKSLKIPPAGQPKKQQEPGFARPSNVAPVADWEGAKTPTNGSAAAAGAAKKFQNDIVDEKDEEDEDDLEWNASEDLDLSSSVDAPDDTDEGLPESKHERESKKKVDSKELQDLDMNQEDIPKSSTSASFEWDGIGEDEGGGGMTPQVAPTTTQQKHTPHQQQQSRQRLGSQDSSALGSAHDGGSAHYEGFGSVLDPNKLSCRESRECEDDSDTDDSFEFNEDDLLDDANTKASEGTEGSTTEFDPLSMFEECEDVMPNIDVSFPAKNDSVEKYNPSSSTLTSSYFSSSVIHKDDSKSISFPSLNSQTVSHLGSQMGRQLNNKPVLLAAPPPPPPKPVAPVPNSPAGTESLESWWQSRYASTQNSDTNSAVQEALMKRIIPSPTEHRTDRLSPKDAPKAPAVAKNSGGKEHQLSSRVEQGMSNPPPPPSRARIPIVVDEEDSIFSGIEDDMSLPSVQYENQPSRQTSKPSMNNKYSALSSRNTRGTKTGSNNKSTNNPNRAIVSIIEDDDESIFSGVSDTESPSKMGEQQSKLSNSQLESQFPRLKEASAMKSLLDGTLSAETPPEEQQQEPAQVQQQSQQHKDAFMTAPAPPTTPYQKKPQSNNASSRLFLPDRGYGVINLQKVEHSPTGNSVTSDITSSVIFGGDFRMDSSRRQSSLSMRNNRPLGILETTDEGANDHHDMSEDRKLAPSDLPVVSQFDVISPLPEEPYEDDIAEAMNPLPPSHPLNEAMDPTPPVQEETPVPVEQQHQKDLFSANASRGVSLMSPSTNDSATNPTNPTVIDEKAPTMLQKIQQLASAKTAEESKNQTTATTTGGEENTTSAATATAASVSEQSANLSVAETVNKVKASFFSQFACGMFAASSFAFCAPDEDSKLPSPVNIQTLAQEDTNIQERQQPNGSAIAVEEEEPQEVGTSGSRTLEGTKGSDTIGTNDITKGSGTLDGTRGSGTLDGTRGSGTLDGTRGSGTIETRQRSGGSDTLTNETNPKYKGKRMSRFLIDDDDESGSNSDNGDGDGTCTAYSEDETYLDNEEGEGSSIGGTLSQSLSGDDEESISSASSGSCDYTDAYEDATAHDGSTIFSDALSVQEREKWKDWNNRGKSRKNGRRREKKGGSKSTMSSATASKSTRNTRGTRGTKTTSTPRQRSISPKDDVQAAESSTTKTATTHRQLTLPPKEEVQAAQSEAYEKLLMYAYTALSVPAPPKAEIVEKGEEEEGNASRTNAKVPTLYPTVLSVQDAELRSEAMVKMLHTLSTEGMEVLKLNREKKWQPRILTITQDLTHFKKSEDIRFKDIDSCPKGLLWVKKFDRTGRNHTMSAIDNKTGKGGMLFQSVQHVSIIKDNYPLSRKQKKGKFKDSITLVLHSNTNAITGQKREVCFRCMNKEGVFALSAGFQAIIDRIHNDSRAEQIRRVKGQLKKMAIDGGAADSIGPLPTTLAAAKPFSPKAIASPIAEDRWEV